MFNAEALSIFYHHAGFYRAITVEEYKNRIYDIDFKNEEFDRICRQWNKASQKIDLYQMAYSEEVFEFLSICGLEEAEYSEWAVEIECEC